MEKVLSEITVQGDAVTIQKIICLITPLQNISFAADLRSDNEKEVVVAKPKAKAVRKKKEKAVVAAAEPAPTKKRGRPSKKTVSNLLDNSDD